MLRHLILSLLLITSLPLYSQESAIESLNGYSTSFSSFKAGLKHDSVLSLRSWKGYVPSLLHNLGYQATFPFRMKGKDFIYLGGTAGITLILLQFDKEIEDHFRPVEARNPFLEDVLPHFTELGDYYGYMLLFGYGTYTVAFHKYRGFRTALLASQAAISAGMWTRVGKILSGRMRPVQTYGDPEYNSDHWFGPFAQFKSKYNSKRNIAGFDAFPSGHTAAIFSMATVFSEQYRDQRAVPIVMYSIAGLVGVSRIIEHQHWASDVFLGGVIGYLCGKQVVNNEKRLFPKYSLALRHRTHSFVFPYSSAESAGLVWKMTF